MLCITQPRPPIAGLPLHGSDGDDIDFICAVQVHKGELELAVHNPARLAPVLRPSFGRMRRLCLGGVNRLVVMLRQSRADVGKVLDLLQELGAKVAGIDPYTFEAYLKRTGLNAEKYSFDDIANGALEGRHYSLIVCSFALHLVELSKLPMLMFQLAQITDTLLILTPHKRPQLKPEWGWNLQAEILEDRVRARLYRTLGDSA